MIKFWDGAHCHWTYRLGEYRSFLTWPTRELIEEQLQDGAYDEIFQVHGTDCECPDAGE